MVSRKGGGALKKHTDGAPNGGKDIKQEKECFAALTKQEGGEKRVTGGEEHGRQDAQRP